MNQIQKKKKLIFLMSNLIMMKKHQDYLKKIQKKN